MSSISCDEEARVDGSDADPSMVARRVLAVLGLLALPALTGCAGLADGFSGYQSGWRHAEVLAVGRADEIQGVGMTDCRLSTVVPDTAGSTFALLTYRQGNRPHRHIVRLESDTTVVRGDRVLANVQTCGLPTYVDRSK